MAVSLVVAIVGAAAALLGTSIGAIVTYSTQRRARAHEFRQQQLDRFYGPLAAMREQVKSLSELRVRISEASDVAWRLNVSGVTPAAVERFRTESGPEFRRIIEDDNAQLIDVLLPTYDRMVRLFVARYWLAEPSTREHLPALIEFVELWRRWHVKALPLEVWERLDHREEKLYPLYNDLASHLDRIRSELAAGR
jgi:hypothetical protein